MLTFNSCRQAISMSLWAWLASAILEQSFSIKAQHPHGSPGYPKGAYYETSRELVGQNRVGGGALEGNMAGRGPCRRKGWNSAPEENSGRIAISKIFPLLLCFMCDGHELLSSFYAQFSFGSICWHSLRSRCTLIVWNQTFLCWHNIALENYFSQIFFSFFWHVCVVV